MMMAAVRKSTNWFAISVTAAVVVIVLVVGGVVWFANSQATSPGTLPQASAVNTDTGAIAIGSGPNTVDTYIDFMCPVCNAFEQSYGPTLKDLVSKNEITLNIHPIAILDRLSQGTQYSTRSANAAYCVAVNNPGSIEAFVTALYAQQPKENTAGLDDAALVSIATTAGASDAVSSCITDGTYTKYVTAMTEKTPIKSGTSSISTPTVVVNGDVLTNLTNPQTDILGRLKG